MAYANVASGDVISASTVNDLIKAAINRPMIRLALGANQSIANNTVTAVTFGAGTEVYDDYAWHSTSSNTSRVIPLQAGRYLCHFNAYFANSGAGDRRIYILKNGSSNGVWNREQTIGNASQTTGVIEVDGSTDYLEAAVFQTSGGALNLQGSGDVTFSSTFEVIYLSGPS